MRNNTETMKKRLRIALILFAALALTLTFSFGTRTQEEVNRDIEETQEQLDEGREKVEQLEDEMDHVREEIEQTEKSISDVTGQIADLQAEISENQQRLEQKRAELEVSIDNLDQRLRNMYKNGTIGFIDVILSSANVSDLITNVELISRIYTSDKNLVTALEREYEEIEEIQISLENQREELDGKLEELNTLEQQLADDYESISNAKLEQEEVNEELQDELAEFEAESAQISAMIANTSIDQEYQGTGSGYMTWPVPGYYRISSDYGYRICPFHGYELHSGIDIPASYGANVVASADGLVISSGWMGSYGNAVLISHGSGLYTLYGHNSSLNVYTGQTVKQGDTIAFIGSTGSSTGNHSHFEVRLGGSNYGNSVNPHVYL